MTSHEWKNSQLSNLIQTLVNLSQSTKSLRPHVKIKFLPSSGGGGGDNRNDPTALIKPRKFLSRLKVFHKLDGGIKFEVFYNNYW